MLAQGNQEISRRDREILRAIIQDFISTGEPVGSLAIAPRCELSSATVRSAMADLEDLGYLAKPHTSAGRIPTDKGFRLYVDSLLRVRGPAPKDRERIDAGVHPASATDLVVDTGKLLHEITHHAALVVAPQFQQDVFRRIEFVQLREDRILAIFVSQAGLVQNRLLTVDFPVGRGELEYAANYLNEKLGELTLEQVHERLRAERAAEQALYDQLHHKTLQLADAAFAAGASPEPDVRVEGEATFLDEPTFASDMEKMRRLFGALAQKDRVLHVLRRVMQAGEIRIFIGAESEFSDVPGLAVVAAPYTQGEKVLGALAVVGPTRMNYGRVIPLVQYTARSVSKAFENG
jgi:heat-inducible transcriptional repressor